jgi:plasmid maintenance system antidote protein VapI
MKSLTKNARDNNLMMSAILIQQMASQLIHVGATNGLVVTMASEVDKNGKPALSYAVRYSEDGDPVFNGKASSDKDAHFQITLDAMRGRIVSELCPPALTEVKPAGFGDSFEKISYWKRVLTVEQNITNQQSKASRKDDEFVKTKRAACWVGYNTKNVECIRVEEGSANIGWEKIDRIEFVDLGPVGMVAAVVIRDADRKSSEPVTLGDMIAEAARIKGNAPQEVAPSSTAIPKSASMSDRFEDTMGSTASVVTAPNFISASAPSTTEDKQVALAADSEKLDLMNKAIDFSRVFEVAGNTVAIPKVLNSSEFTALPDQAKGDYLKIVSILAHGYLAGYFEDDNPELNDYMGNFLCDAAETDLFDAEYRAEISNSSQATFNVFVDRTAFTAMLLGYTPELMVKLYGNVSPIKRDSDPKDLPDTIEVRELAKVLNTHPSTVIKIVEKMMGDLVTINQSLHRDVAASVAKKIGVRILPKLATVKEVAEKLGVDVKEVSAFLDAYGYDATADTPLTADVVGMINDRFPTPTEVTVKVLAEKLGVKVADITKFLDARNGNEDAYFDTMLSPEQVADVTDHVSKPATDKKPAPRRRAAKSPDVPDEKEVKAEVKRITKAAAPAKAPARKPAAKKAATIKK